MSSCSRCTRLTDASFYPSESLYEAEGLPQEAHDSAALLASKVYYYLGEYDEALSFALGAGSAFEHDSRTPGTEEYVETVVCEYWPMNMYLVLVLIVVVAAKAIDRYIQSRLAEQTEGKIDPRLQGIIEGIFRRCVEDGEYRQVCVVRAWHTAFANTNELSRLLASRLSLDVWTSSNQYTSKLVIPLS